MLYKIVENEFKPTTAEYSMPAVDYDQNDWNSSALFEFAYGEIQNQMVVRQVLVPTDLYYTPNTQTFEDNLK